MLENRTVLRQNTSLKGEILVNEAAPVACMVVDLSPKGAKLSVPQAVVLPASFQLRAADLDLDVRAKMVWRTPEEIGVRFSLLSEPEQP